MSGVETVEFALEALYQHQDHHWVVDAVPAVLAWLQPRTRSRAPYVFDVEHGASSRARPTHAAIALGWDLRALARHDPEVAARAARLRSGRSVDRERVAENAAYGLALVAISRFLPGRRVVAMRKGLAPDFLFDVTPGALRGGEVAGRSEGGRAALRVARIGSSKQPSKAAQLRAMTDVAEAWLSLWCAAPRVADWYKVKP